MEKNGNEPNAIVVYNIIGASVKRFNKGSYFDLSYLSPGMYLVQVSDSNGNKIVKRINKII